MIKENKKTLLYKPFEIVIVFGIFNIIMDNCINS